MGMYPTKEQLKTIREWDCIKDGFHGLLEYIKPFWNYSDIGYWTKRGNIYRIYTGGWSGNETIIAALEMNYLFWGFSWYSSKRGGHFVFRIRAPKK